jgi:peroxiredoxin Q/BCP
MEAAERGAADDEEDDARHAKPVHGDHARAGERGRGMNSSASEPQDVSRSPFLPAARAQWAGPPGLPIGPRRWAFIPAFPTQESYEKATKRRQVRSMLAVGDKAPGFSLKRDGGGTVSFDELKGGHLVLYFYPRAEASGCTREGVAFDRLRHEFEKAGTAILGVSADPVAALDRFKARHALSIALASDESHAMLRAYGAWGEKSLYGRKYLGVHRITYLIDRDGRIARTWPHVQVTGHAEEVLAAARALSAA